MFSRKLLSLERTQESRPDSLGVKLFILQKFHKSRLLVLVDSKVSRKILTKSVVTDHFHLLAPTEAQFLTTNRLKILIKMLPDISVKRNRSKFLEVLFIVNNFGKNNFITQYQSNKSFTKIRGGIRENSLFSGSQYQRLLSCF